MSSRESSTRRVCVVTGSRSEYGLLYWLIREIREDPALTLQLVATGMHLSSEFGLTYQFIERDGFAIDAKVEMLLAADTPTGIAKSVGLGVIGFADVFARLQPDVVVVFGDRYEVLAAAQAAMLARIPIAHISGGEVTEGALDDVIRHALTKMAYLHFVSAEPYRRRVIQLGEDPSRVMNCGDPGVEKVLRAPHRSREQLSTEIGFDLREPFFLVTYHPETMVTAGANCRAVANMLNALENFPEHRVLITKANADEGGRAINAVIDEYVSRHSDRVHAAMSLGDLNYSSAMAHCDAVVGNSSSGLVEAPALRKPTVNIGRRQHGRLLADSVISTDADAAAITAAIRRALTPAFIDSFAAMVPPYGGGETSRAIAHALKTSDLTGARKAFYDVEWA